MDIKAKIRRILNTPGWDQSRLAEAIGVSQPTVSRWLDRSEPRGHRRDKILDLYETITGELRNKIIVPIVGRVGATLNGNIMYGDGDATTDYAELPPGAGTGCVAVEVVGHSMGLQAPDGSLIFFDETHTEPPGTMIGELVVVALPTGERMVKRLLRGTQPNLFDLESINGEFRRDVEVEWAAHIHAIVPPHRARQIIRRA